MISNFGQRYSQLVAAAFKKLRSNGALCATKTVSFSDPKNSRRMGKTSWIRGAEKTISSVMPVSAVINEGIGDSGFTKV